MSGFGFWSHDIGGFESTSTPDVYKRWAAFGLLSTHSRLHGSTSYRVPWAYDDEAVKVVSFFTKLKASLMPYLYRNAVQTSETGVPMLRSMIIEYMKDPTCAYLDKQYMLGDSLLVAPILNEDSLGHYYLPKGTWTSYLTNEVKEGGTWFEESYDYLSLPLFVKENTILAVGSMDQGAVYNYAQAVTLKIYALTEGVECNTVVYDELTKLAVKASAIKKNGCILVKVESDLPYTLELINIKSDKVETSGTVVVKANTTCITIAKGETTVIS
jgi:alpha-D-xyloside xylohydrolase